MQEFSAQQYRRNGFTLIEIIIVVAIILLLTAVIIPGLRIADKSLALDREARTVAQDIRRTMEFALRAQEFTGCIGPNIISGYGVHFNKNLPGCYLIYAECGGSKSYEGEKCDETAGSGPDKKIEIVKIEKGIQIQSISPSPNVDILFIPPDPLLYVNGNENNSATIVLELIDDASQTRTITISSKGVIDID